MSDTIRIGDVVSAYTNHWDIALVHKVIEHSIGAPTYLVSFRLGDEREWDTKRVLAPVGELLTRRCTKTNRCDRPDELHIIIFGECWVKKEAMA